MLDIFCYIFVFRIIELPLRRSVELLFTMIPWPMTKIKEYQFQFIKRFINDSIKYLFEKDAKWPLKNLCSSFASTEINNYNKDIGRERGWGLPNIWTQGGHRHETMQPTVSNERRSITSLFLCCEAVELLNYTGTEVHVGKKHMIWAFNAAPTSLTS